MKKLLFQIVLVSSISLLCFSCYYDEIPDHILNPPELPTDPGDPDYVEFSFGDDIQPIFNANCIGCHSSQTPILTENNAYNNIVPDYITPNDADNSALYNKVLGGGHGGLTSDETNLIKAWINQGAENN